MEIAAESQKGPQLQRKPVKDSPFWAICLGHTFTHWYPSTFYILLPFITVELGLSTTQAGLLITSMYLFKSFASMPIGAITDMTSNKTIMMVLSLSLAGLPFAFMGMANTYGMFMLLVIVMGIGNEMWHPASFSTLSYRYPEYRGFVFGFHGMAANLGDLLAPVVIGTFLATMNWRDTVKWNVIPGIVVAVLVILLFRNKKTSAKTAASSTKNEQHAASFADYFRGLRELLRNRSVLLLALASGMRSMSQNGLMTFLPIYLALELHLSPFLVGLYVTIMQAGGLLAAPIMGSVSDRVGRRKIIYSGMVMTSAMIVAVVLIQIEWLLIVTMALLGFFLYSLRPIMQAWAMETTKKHMAGTTTSLLFSTQALLASFSPLIGGLLADRFGMVAAFYFIAAIILAGNLVVFLIPKTPPMPEG